MRVARNVHEKVSKHAVHQPWWAISRTRVVQSGESQFQFVNRIRTSFIHSRRLTRRADERSGKEVRQCRMIQPVPDETLQQIGTAKERTVGWRCSTKRQMIAAAGSGVPLMRRNRGS